uniref:Uncharacterized protein n=1 Tax=uncultured marine virus TaxID=186617 RepID=A0A0F7L615_9VIRU|nr:hypothetical protein [uncultured marine virus]
MNFGRSCKSLQKKHITVFVNSPVSYLNGANLWSHPRLQHTHPRIGFLQGNIKCAVYIFGSIVEVERLALFLQQVPHHNHLAFSEEKSPTNSFVSCL